MGKARSSLDNGAEVRLGEAAELLGVGPDTVRCWIDGGRLEGRPAEGASARRPAGASARNRFRGIVTRVVHSGLACWPTRS